MNKQGKTLFSLAGYYYKILYLLFLISFIAYLSTLSLRPYPLSYIAKIIPLICLMFLVINYLGYKKVKFLLAGLVFSAAGDVLLDFKGSSLFVPGLSCFAIAHLMYILALWAKPDLKKKNLLLIAAFSGYGVVIWSLLFPHLGEMLIPVTIYILLITLMGISASTGIMSSTLMIVGAALFVISDSVIAINMFLFKVHNSSFWIMVTYFPAQFLITYGYCKPFVSINNRLSKIF